MEEKNNQKEELEKEIEKLKEQVEIENLKKQRDELREKLKSQNNGEYGTIPLDDKQSNNKEIENDTGGKTGKIKEMLVVVLSALAVVIIIIIAITAFRIKNESRKVYEKTEKKDNQKSNVEVVVSSPQTPGTVPDATQNPVDPNLVIPENPISDATVQENQSVKPEEEIKKGTEYYTKSTKGPVNVRKTSSINSELQDELPDGIVLKFIGKEGKWYRVSYTINNQTREGFIHLSQIRKK